MTRKELVKKLRQAIILINSGTASAREVCKQLELTRSTLIRNTIRDEIGNLHLIADSENVGLALQWLEKAYDVSLSLNNDKDKDFLRYCMDKVKQELTQIYTKGIK